MPIAESVCQWMLRRGNPRVRPRELISAGFARTSPEAERILAELLAAGRVHRFKKAGAKVERYYLNKHQAPSS